MSRREVLQVGGAGLLGVGSGTVAAAESAGAVLGRAARAKSVMFLYLFGGPSQLETFDMKPKANQGYRGDFNPIETTVGGMQVCEHLPMMAGVAEHFSVIRSTFHNSNTHGIGVHYNMTGLKNAPRSRGEPQMDRVDPPCVGGVIRQLRGDRNGLPASVQLPVRIGDQNNFQWGGQHAGFLGPNYDPLMLIDESWQPGTLPPGFRPPKGVGDRRQANRQQLLSRVEESRGTVSLAEANYGRFQQQALDILGSNSAWRAFTFDDESPETLARYGDNKFGRSCLVARRLVEAGVGLVTVPWMYLHSTKNFDTHDKHFKVMKDLLLPPMDRAFSALIEDLGQRGRLDETLIAWTGEFGRTPKVNKKAGRDHWGSVYSTVLAGGGIRGGQVYGSSDKIAGLPADNPVHVRDFIATIYHALGYGPDTRVVDPTGRPYFVVEGTPVHSLF